MHQEKRYNLKKASGLENSSAEGRNDAYGAGNSASFHLWPYMGEILRKPQSETATESQSGGLILKGFESKICVKLSRNSESAAHV